MSKEPTANDPMGTICHYKTSKDSHLPLFINSSFVFNFDGKPLQGSGYSGPSGTILPDEGENISIWSNQAER